MISDHDVHDDMIGNHGRYEDRNTSSLEIIVSYE